jgi:phospholipid/cholesterol/gamma-HCH transport system substrate-binding protein
MSALTRNVRVGLMFLIGLVLLIGALYFIGNRQNLFGNTIKIQAEFEEVNGLMKGNKVRYSGIDVGTVSDVRILNDSIVLVDMVIDAEATSFIRTNALAAVGSDGLMGNKILNINASKGEALYIKEGDVIKSVTPLDTDEIMRTLSRTNDDMSMIAQNLKSITQKIEDENMVWNLLSDSALALNIKNTVRNVDYTSAELTNISRTFSQVAKDVQDGKGTVGKLLKDTSFIERVDNALLGIQNVSDSLNRLTGNISDITDDIKAGKGAAGRILKDEQFDKDLTETMENMKKASKALEEDLEALKHSIFFRKYFKKKAKEEKK